MSQSCQPAILAANVLLFVPELPFVTYQIYRLKTDRPDLSNGIIRVRWLNFLNSWAFFIAALFQLADEQIAFLWFRQARDVFTIVGVAQFTVNSYAAMKHMGFQDVPKWANVYLWSQIVLAVGASLTEAIIVSIVPWVWTAILTSVKFVVLTGITVIALTVIFDRMRRRLVDFLTKGDASDAGPNQKHVRLVRGALLKMFCMWAISVGVAGFAIFILTTRIAKIPTRVYFNPTRQVFNRCNLALQGALFNAARTGVLLWHAWLPRSHVSEAGVTYEKKLSDSSSLETSERKVRRSSYALEHIVRVSDLEKIPDFGGS